ncbi:MAG: branched-chain amino acid transaminase, partial [Candidatus Aminicenantales bacterium]
RGPAVFRLPEHLERFFYSASVLRMEIPYSAEEITQAVKLLLRENELESAYIRPLLFFAYGNLGLVPKFCPVQLMIAAWEWGAYLGQRTEQGVHVYILPYKRIHHSQFDMKAKVGGLYILSTIAGNEAREKGYDEAVFLNLEENVAEGPGENIFVVKEGVLRTNDMRESILEGITRTSILEIARDMGIPTEIGPITKKAFLDADEVFFSGTAVETAPIIRVTDGSRSGVPPEEYTIGTGKPGEITKRLSAAYKNIVRGGDSRYERWLTYMRD